MAWPCFAMATALLFPEPENKGGRGKNPPKDSDNFSQDYLGMARTVLRQTPDSIGTSDKFDRGYRVTTCAGFGPSQSIVGFTVVLGL